VGSMIAIRSPASKSVARKPPATVRARSARSL
jgi:hypothetical protein